MALPIWLWLVICVVILVAGGVAWLRRVAITDPKAARAMSSGQVFADASLDSRCRASIREHELTAPGQTTFLALLSPLEFTSANVRARTPVSLALSDRTMGVTYRQGSLGNVATVIVDRQDIRDGHPGEGGSGFGYTLSRISQPGSMTILLQSEGDRQQLASWIGAGLPGRTA
jgi:hypothetical protein